MNAAAPGESSLAEYFKKGRQLTCEAGQVILAPGEASPEVFYIENGFIKVYSISRRGEIYLHIIYKSGEIFPLTWTIKNSRHDVFYEAISDTGLRRLPKADFLKFVKSNSAAAYILLEQFAAQFDIHISRVENLQHRRADERVAHRLLALAKRFGQEHGGETIIDAPITHQLIADSINLTRESVSRAIEKLENLGAIRYSERKIVIRNSSLLAGIFND